MKNTNNIHIGKLLKAYTTQNKVRIAGWARKSGKSPKTIGKYFRQPTMRVETLLDICLTLNHNFFKDIAATLPPDMPPLTPNPLQQRVTELETQNHDLQLQVKTLERALELIGKKG